MTTKSAFQGTGLSIGVYAPNVFGGTFLWDVADDVNAYSHSITADGGYQSCTFTISGDRSFLEDWLAKGLGRIIRVHGPSYNVIWEGYVNQVDVTLGNIQMTRGPLSSIANRVVVAYTPIIDESTDPPSTGTPTETTIAENEDSQNMFGIWEKVVNGGTVLDADAENIRDVYLKENSYPDAKTSLAYGSDSGTMEATISCRGFIDFFGYVYNYSVEPNQSVRADQKIVAIINEDPNNIISRTTTFVNYNAVLVPEWDNENRTAKTIIDEIISFGGGTDERWLFGMRGWSLVYFEEASTEIDYYYYIADGVQKIETARGVRIQPWDVVPGKWVALPDWMWGSSVRSFVVESDPRVFFIEQVDFTAPDVVTVNGGKIRRLPQYLAKLGVSGS